MVGTVPILVNVIKFVLVVFIQNRLRETNVYSPFDPSYALSVSSLRVFPVTVSAVSSANIKQQPASPWKWFCPMS